MLYWIEKILLLILNVSLIRIIKVQNLKIDVFPFQNAGIWFFIVGYFPIIQLALSPSLSVFLYCLSA